MESALVGSRTGSDPPLLQRAVVHRDEWCPQVPQERTVAHEPEVVVAGEGHVGPKVEHLRETQAAQGADVPRPISGPTHRPLRYSTASLGKGAVKAWLPPTAVIGSLATTLPVDGLSHSQAYVPAARATENSPEVGWYARYSEPVLGSPHETDRIAR